MAITYSPEAKAAMLAAIGDVGQGVPFDSIVLTTNEFHLPMIVFRQNGTEMYYVPLSGDSAIEIQVSGHLPLQYR